MNEKWDVRFLELAEHISQWSKDPSTKVGAVIVRPDKTIASVGYNGFPKGVADLEERYDDRETKYKMVVHAELNAILNAKEPLDDCTIYIWPTLIVPAICDRCLVAAIQVGIKTIVCHPQKYFDEDACLRWEPVSKIVNTMCREAGINIRTI